MIQEVAIGTLVSLVGAVVAYIKVTQRHYGGDDQKAKVEDCIVVAHIKVTGGHD